MCARMPRSKAYSYVRMSTDAQLKGDSKRRQLEMSAKYAAENDLDLVPDSQLEDIGVSAFTGANTSTGALGIFLQAVRDKKVLEGSYLLVESFDRLSRQELTKALPPFLEIINSGIILVTLADQRKYTPGKVEINDLLYSIMIMSRAHEESATKMADTLGRQEDLSCPDRTQESHSQNL